MNRLLTTIGLGVALAVVASPAAAQSVAVDVGIHAGPIHGRVVYGPSPVYQTPYRAYAQDYRYSDRRYEGRANKHLRKHERHWRKAQEKYDKRLRKIHREQAKAEREYEREYQRWQREVGRQRYRRYCTAPGFLDSGLKVITSMLPRLARPGRVAPGLGFDSRTSQASTVRCMSA